MASQTSKGLLEAVRILFIYREKQKSFYLSRKTRIVLFIERNKDIDSAAMMVIDTTGCGDNYLSEVYCYNDYNDDENDDENEVTRKITMLRR